MNRKVALVGCKEGPMIYTKQMGDLRVKAQVRADTMLEVEHHSLETNKVERSIFVGAGYYKLGRSLWARIRVKDGPFVDALCFIDGVQCRI